MAKDMLRYDQMVESALRGVVRQVLEQAAENGLPGEHHFYVTFRTGDDGVQIPPYLSAQYPDEMTIILQHQFWGLAVDDEALSITLSFNDVRERLFIPLAAITAFADPSVNFGLQFRGSITKTEMPHAATTETAAAVPEEPPRLMPDENPGNVVKIDTFRKK